MRVLMFGWEFPPHISGGLGTACYELTRALARQGVEIVFVVPRARAGARSLHVRLLAAAGVPVPTHPRRPAVLLRRLRLRAVDSPLRPYARPAAPPGAAEAVDRLLLGDSDYGPTLFAEVLRYSDAAEVIARGESFDVIHAHDWMAVPAALRAREATGRPLVLHIHSLEFDRSRDRPDPRIVAIERGGLEAADHVIAVSEYTRQEILERYGIAPHRVSVVHNAVSRRAAPRLYRMARAPRPKTVLFLGRITAQKGPESFVEAAARVLRVVPDVRFVMAGAGDLLPQMVRRVAQLRLGDHFHFTGFLHGVEVERMYAMSDVYVMPSVSEPFGISPLEAMLHDVPVIVPRRSGVAEVLTHALQVDFQDVDDLADKIVALLRHPALSRELRRGARRELRALRWEAAAERVLAIYRMVTG